MKFIYSLALVLSFMFVQQNNLIADTYFLDFKSILNQSSAGKKANDVLNNQLKQGLKKLVEREKQLQEEEKKIVQQKKILSPEEYKKSISGLRNKVSKLQKDRNIILETVSKKRNNARKQLLGAINPIVKTYMQEKNIKIVLDKKSILLADENLDITNDIMNLLNKNLKSLKLN